jgi:hypothetical protein
MRPSSFQRIDIPLSRDIESKYDDIKVVADNIDTLDSLYADKAKLDAVYADLTKIIAVTDNEANINEVVNTVIPNMAEILQADDNAAVATQKASEALASANASEVSRQASETAQGITETARDTTLGYRDEAETFKDTASLQAGIATTKAGEASASASAALISRNQAETFAQQAQTSAESVDAGNLVHKTGNETISGIKTFTSSPIVPVPTDNFQVATKQYVDDSISKLSTDYYQGPYGIQWDYTTDTYIRIGAKGYTAIQSLMRRCVVKADGTVNYYLNPDNSNFKEDGTPSVLSGADGNVMVEIPKHYIKVETVDNIDSFSVSLTPEVGYVLDPAFLKWNGTAMVEVPYRYFRAYEGFVSGGKLLSVSGVTPTRSQTISVFRTQAMANGAGWHLTDWNLLNTIKRLCYIEFCDFIVTKYLGNGNDTGADYGLTTGQSNALGNRSSNSTHNDMYMSYRGIENMYADIWEFVDGVNVNNYQFYVNGKYSTFASDVFTGDYVAKGPLTAAGVNNGLIKRCAVSVEGGFIPTVVGGSTTTFYGDAFWSATGDRIVFHGGPANAGASDGLGALSVLHASSLSDVAIGAAVCR